MSKKRVFVSLMLLLFGAFSLGDIYSLNRGYQKNLFTVSPVIAERDEGFYHQRAVKEFYDVKSAEFEDLDFRDDSAYQQYQAVRGDKGIINWYGNINLTESAVPKFFWAQEDGRRVLNPAYKGEVYFTSSTNSASIKRFTPNEILLEVNLERPDRLIVNQNYFRGWKSDKGEVRDYNGLLSILLEEKGIYAVKLRYIPVSFYVGCLISLISILFLAWFNSSRKE